MRIHNLGPAALVVAVVVAIASPGCDGGSETGASSGSTEATTSSSSTSGTGGAGGDGGGGATGSGGGAAADNGAPATETVSAGEVSTSASYKMVHTFGQPTQNQGKTTSSGYRLQGGLNGANGSLP